MRCWLRWVSVLFNEPKLLKFEPIVGTSFANVCFSALQRAEIAEIRPRRMRRDRATRVSVLFNEPKLLKLQEHAHSVRIRQVSVLFNEPKLLKF